MMLLLPPPPYSLVPSHSSVNLLPPTASLCLSSKCLNLPLPRNTGRQAQAHGISLPCLWSADSVGTTWQGVSLEWGGVWPLGIDHHGGVSFSWVQKQSGWRASGGLESGRDCKDISGGCGVVALKASGLKEELEDWKGWAHGQVGERQRMGKTDFLCPQRRVWITDGQDLARVQSSRETPI